MKRSTARRNPQVVVCAKSSPGSEAWQQTVQGHSGPTVPNPTVSEIDKADPHRKMSLVFDADI